MNKENVQLGIFVFVGIVIALSNQVIQFLNNFGLSEPQANLAIVAVVILLVWYNLKIAKLLAGV